MPGLFEPLTIRTRPSFARGFHLHPRLQRDKPARQAANDSQYADVPVFGRALPQRVLQTDRRASLLLKLRT